MISRQKEKPITDHVIIPKFYFINNIISLNEMLI